MEYWAFSEQSQIFISLVHRKVRKRRGTYSTLVLLGSHLYGTLEREEKGSSLTPVSGPHGYQLSLGRLGGKWGGQIMYHCFKPPFVLHRDNGKGNLYLCFGSTFL